MPLWNVYCTEGTYSKDDKRAFAEAITDIYASEAGGLPEMMMPRFYVVVVFHDVPKDSLFIGGVPRNDFVRFSIDHIAYAMPDEFRELMLKFMNKTIHPFVRDRGLDWEIHIDDTPRNQWTFRGCVLPTPGPRRKSAGFGRTSRPSQRPTPRRRTKPVSTRAPAMTDTPGSRRAFDAVERTVSARVDAVTASVGVSDEFGLPEV